MPVTSSSAARASALLEQGAADRAVALASEAASRGDADAVHLMALWRVYGAPLPRSFGEARRLFGLAAAGGHPAAATAHAVFTALGAGGEPDWSGALAVIGRAARQHSNAAAQSTLIDAMTLDGQGMPVEAPATDLLARAPVVAVVRGLLSPGECAHMIALADPLLTPSIIADPATGQSRAHPIRTSDGAVLGPIQMDLVVEAINRRIAAATRTSVERGEPLTVLRYRPGQQYRPHHDCLPNEDNQRVMTAIVYLNDDYEGGATTFDATGLAFRGNTGDLIMFANTDALGRPDPRSRHAGLPVTRGEKWIATRWIRARAFDPWGLRTT